MVVSDISPGYVILFSLNIIFKKPFKFVIWTNDLSACVIRRLLLHNYNSYSRTTLLRP